MILPKLFQVTYPGPGGKEMVTQLYFEGHNSDGFKEKQRNQVKKVVGGRVTFHIYPENFESLNPTANGCPFKFYYGKRGF